jgi:hypothetical protein
MPTPRVAVELAKRVNQLGADRVKMNVADRFPEILVLFTDDGLVAVLEKMTVAPVTWVI